jgi:hypothetical protein
MRFDKHALILAVVEGLRQQGSWTGKTHVQKTLFLLDASGFLKTSFNFVLYKHGPYSFDFVTELEQMKSYAALNCDTAERWHGVRLSPGMNTPFVKRAAPLPDTTQKAIELACHFVGTKGVVELEPLATAVWIRTREHVVDPEKVALRLHQLKPHVAVHDAQSADREARNLLDAAQKFVQARQI